MKIYTADDECPKEEIEYTVTRRGTSIGPHAGMEDVSAHESFDDAQDAISEICDDTDTREWMYLIRQSAGCRTARITEGTTIRFNNGFKPSSPDPTRVEVTGMRVQDDGRTVVQYRVQESCGGGLHSRGYRSICRLIASGSVEVIDRRGDFEGFDPVRESLGGPGRSNATDS